MQIEFELFIPLPLPFFLSYKFEEDTSIFIDDGNNDKRKH